MFDATKQCEFYNVGFSTEDRNLYQDTGIIYEFKYNYLIEDGYQFLATDRKEAFADFIKYATEREYVNEDTFKEAVAKWESLVDNKVGVFFTWGVEYDYNIMFIEGIDATEAVELFEMLKYEKENCPND